MHECLDLISNMNDNNNVFLIRLGYYVIIGTCILYTLATGVKRDLIPRAERQHMCLQKQGL